MGCFPSIITQSRSMASIHSQSVSASTLFFNKYSHWGILPALCLLGQVTCSPVCAR